MHRWFGTSVKQDGKSNFAKASRDELGKLDPQPLRAQYFLIDSPWPRPPTSDWPAADSQATPTLPLQCDVAPLPRVVVQAPLQRASAPHGRGAPIATRGAA